MLAHDNISSMALCLELLLQANPVWIESAQLAHLIHQRYNILITVILRTEPFVDILV